MTTAAEVKRWTRPLLARHPDLLLVGRDLLLRPLNHIYRAIRFMGSSQRTYPNPTASFGVLFVPPSVPMSHTFGLDLMVGHSTDSGFAAKLSQMTDDALERGLRRLDTIQALYELTCEDGLLWNLAGTGLLHSPPLQAAVLAALGKLEDLCAAVDAELAENEVGYLELLEEGLIERERGGRDNWGDHKVSVANTYIARHKDMKLLADLARSNDRASIAAQLHQWEAQRIDKLGLEPYWQPSPFPLELL